MRCELFVVAGQAAGLVFPDFSDPVVTAAGIAVVLVAERVLFVIVLVVVLGRPEFFERDDFGGDGFFKSRFESRLG